LEHKIERDREVVYMKNMLEDLKKDTTNINIAVTGNRFYVAGIDTFLDLLSNQQTDTSYLFPSKYLLLYADIIFGTYNITVEVQRKFSLNKKS